MDKGFYIGELARITGLNTNTIRYYETQGLLLTVERNEVGYRIYSLGDAERLTFIKKAKAIGLSLAEVKDIIDHWTDGTSPCKRVETFLEQKIADVKQRIQDLQTFQDELVALQRRMAPTRNTPYGTVCGYIEELELKGEETHHGA